MTKEWYINNGFELSPLIETAVIERAEREVNIAYIIPIIGQPQTESDAVKYARGSLAFLLMLQRTIFATRAGAKIKNGYNSMDAEAWQKLSQTATTCHLALEALRKEPQANKDAEITDVCKIYFKTNFISL